MNQRLDELHRINYLSSEMEALYHQFSLKAGVSDSVSRVLYAICDRGDGCLLSDVYKSTGLRKQTVHSAIQSLEADGALSLQADGGRAKRIVLSDKGRALVQRTAAWLMQAEMSAFDTWTQEEISTYLRLMERYLECLRVQIENV